ncbi:hypothetical protein BHYA_0094g00380 [Botrytis hyacinthi]|uniref:Heterokaryon incompatibility domain-containing protein n=1 Tax=Botrytis hyacinthi TaxID=278943 RepID=A0A4Z1GKV3_9HELO|nr:hypothetical protein BHYA_0094g00380 [Botrytis hyacinthi]
MNLYAALLDLRDHSFERILWVDTICIDQNNIEERNQQVQLIAKIYSSAYRVVVWLGEEKLETRGALEAIQLFANEELIKHLKEEVEQQCVLNLLRNPWFQRIWVLQEIATARNVIVILVLGTDIPVETSSQRAVMKCKDKRLLEAVSGCTAAFGKGALFGQISQYGRTLLSFTAGEGHEDIVKLLLEIINPDILNWDTDRTPFLFAVENGYEAVVKLLLATHQIDPNSKGELDRTTLSFAAENKHKTVVKLLLTVD